MCLKCRLFRRRSCEHKTPAREQPKLTAADKALEQARETLQVARDARSEAGKEAKALRKLRTENHFADLVQETFFRGGHA